MKTCKQCGKRLDQHSLNQLRACDTAFRHAVETSLREAAERQWLEAQLESK